MEQDKLYDTYERNQRAARLEAERRSSFNKGDVVEKLAILLVTIGVVAFFAFSVANMVKHSMENAANVIAHAGQH
jgi:hypothetical protein